MKVALAQIDPELRGRGRLLRLVMRTWSEGSYRKADRISDRLQRGRMPKDLATEVRWLPRRDGSAMRVVIFRPLTPAAGPGPAVLWLHGGGYVGGVPEGYSTVAWVRRLIQASGAVVVSPDYRLAGAAPYPAAFDDAYLALRWLAEHAEELGARADQVAVGGESAGGGLTAAVSLAARDRGDVAIAFQMPLYPMLDDRCTTASMRDNDAPAWDERVNRLAWRVYLDGAAGSADVPAYAAPARAMDLGRLPPAVSFVGELDPFRDEVADYVERLRAADVEVAFETFAGAYHGFDVAAPGAAVSRRAIDFVMAWYAGAVARFTAPQP